MPRDKKSLSNKNEGRNISTFYETFRQKIAKRAKRSSSLFKAHSFAFVSINAFLVFLNVITRVSYPWFLFPLGGMSILLSLHYASKNDREKQKQTIEKYPDLTDKAFKLLKKLFKKRRFTGLSTVFSVSISAFLFMVNIITGPGFLWASIPAAALFTLSGTIWFFNMHNKKELIEEFQLRSAEKGIISGPVSANKKINIIGSENKQPVLTEAYSLKDSILNQLRQLDTNEDPIIETIPELVENYILQIKTLLEKNDEFTGILKSNPYEDLLKMKIDIKSKMALSDDNQLLSQYKTSLKELDNHLAASKKIANQIELFTLKINSALNSLRMLHLDLANLNVEKLSHNEVMKVLEKEFSNLSQRLEDLQEGYSEIEKEI
jgi:2TM domain